MKEAAYRYDKHCRIRTNDPEITNHVLWPTELKRRYFLLRVQRYEFILKMQIRHVLFLYLQSH